MSMVSCFDRFRGDSGLVVSMESLFNRFGGVNGVIV